MAHPRDPLVVARTAVVMRPRGMRPARAHARGRIGRRAVALAVAGVLATAASLAAHDLFLRPATYFASPNARVLLRVLNGTFTSSVSPVTADRVRAVSVVGPDGVARLDTSAWRWRGDTTVLTITTGAPSTYVVGASLRPRELRLAAEDFNKYLASDGVPDVLEARRRDGELGAPARERYSKHVKALLQVGDARSDAYQTALGYPAELIPLDNPYALRPGATMRVRALVDGSPVANQFVVAGGRTSRGARVPVQSVRTDSAGVARVRLGTRGQWYVKFIRMVRLQGDTAADYESKWATITFEVR